MKVQAMATAGILDRLSKGVLIADGAMGTMLETAGMKPGACPELWNVENASAVADIHRGYADAGAGVVLTNTFGGSRPKLERYGLGERVVEINAAAVALARAIDGPFVAASIGPTGKLLEPYGEATVDELAAAFSEQIEACAAADIIWIETMTDVGEARAAVDAAKRATDLPIALTFTYDSTPSGPRTMMGVTPEAAAEEFDDVAILGVNCGTVEVCLATLQAYREAGAEMSFVARANAGLPKWEHGRTVFPEGPEAYAESIRPLAEVAGVIGGCCGTTPSHIAEVATAVGGA
jgi:5-methyltetrahydrofolate--homocysteine methyltransferase